MSSIQKLFKEYKNRHYDVLFYTLGRFEANVFGEHFGLKKWGREKTIQLMQFLITQRHQIGLHKEVIADRIWDTYDADQINRDFKVALHGIRKVLEPGRKKRSEESFILRQGSTYKLNTQQVWIDADAMDYLYALGNKANDDPDIAIIIFNEVIDLYKGMYLPNRMYEDWSSGERERLQVQALNAYMTLAELQLETQPRESIRLAQMALKIDNTWEDAYRIQMEAFFKTGNRPQAIKVYKECQEVLQEEYGISPLPQTKSVYNTIIA